MAECTDGFTDCTDVQLGDSQLFRKILRKVGNCFSIAITGSITTSSSSTTRTPSRQIVSTVGSGVIGAGSRAFTIELSADFTGVIDGDNTTTGMLTPSGSYSWAAGQNDDDLTGIPYTITTGRIAVQKVT